jgi:hypothetical protein
VLVSFENFVNCPSIEKICLLFFVIVSFHGENLSYVIVYCLLSIVIVIVLVSLQLYYSRLLIHELEFVFIKKFVFVISDDYCIYFMLKWQVSLSAISIGGMCNLWWLRIKNTFLFWIWDDREMVLEGKFVILFSKLAYFPESKSLVYLGCCY